MKKTQKIAPMYLTVPITRVDKDTREVEGYAFVNEVVPGEGGMRLKRSAMQAATSDYMKWGAIREMHQPSAVGTALEARWDDTGLIVRATIVDDDAWKKVEARVYKAYSVGVQPRVMRGNDVEVCTHVETSLVDRPKDEDAVLFRVDGAEEADCEMIDDEPEEVETTERGMFAENWANREKSALYYAAFDMLSSCLFEIQYDDDITDKQAQARTAIAEFADVVAPLCERCEVPKISRIDATLSTVQLEPGVIARIDHLEQTISAKDTDLATVRADLAASVERVKALENKPEPMKAVRFPGVALERTFPANGEPSNDAPSIEDQIATLTRKAESASDQERQNISAAIMILQRQAS